MTPLAPGSNTIGEDTWSLIGEAVDAFAQPDPARTRRSRDLHAGFERAVWSEIARLGWLTAAVPEAQGGLGMSLDVVARIAQRLGYAGYMEPYVTAGAMPALALSRCEGARALELLQSLASGHRVITLAWQPPDGRLSPADTAVRAGASGTGWQLDGTCRFLAASDADWLLVVARGCDDDSTLLFDVDTRQPGVALASETNVDGTTLIRATLQAVHCPASSLLARDGPATRIVDAAVRAGIVATAAELLGVIQRALELTLGYLKERRQFDRPIGSFQALQHRAVDMWVQQELTRATLRTALARLADADSTPALADAAASAAKARASQAAIYVCGQAVQLHGAIGFTDEYALGHYVNRALVLSARLGNAAHHRRRFAALQDPATTAYGGAP